VDSGAIVILTVIFSILTMAMVRLVRPRRRRVLFLIPIVVAALALRWAAYRGTWVELGLASLASASICAAWWLVYARHLPPPTDDDIRVWTEDDPF
jgi:hypothetical protein